jgi:hypothetical protein
MKKIYLSLFAVFLLSTSKSQTLTAAANEPAIGDMTNYTAYDSLATGIPKSTGMGQTWNFNGFPQGIDVYTKNYSSPSSVPESTMFPGCTVVEVEAGSDNYFWKSVSSPVPQLELLGMNDPSNNTTISFTNSAIAFQWPVSYGYNQTDVAVGSATYGASGPAEVTVTTMGSGTGTLTLPGGQSLSNILQVKSTLTISIRLIASFTIDILQTNYEYYHGSQKYSVLKVSYESSTLTPAVGSPTPDATAEITVNNNVITGINEKNFDATFQIFPNPAKDAFTVNLTNKSGDKGVLEIFDAKGTLVKSVRLGSADILRQDISLQGLSSGLYLVKTSIGERVSERKLIVE